MTITPQPQAILQAIHAHTIQRRAELKREISEIQRIRPPDYFGRFQEMARELRALQADGGGWTFYSTDRLVGRPLTAAERKRTQRIVSKLRDDGYIEVMDGRVRLTRSGRRAVETSLGSFA